MYIARNCIVSGCARCLS